MTEEELREITALLERQGWSPMLCDSPIPLYDTPVHAGNPVEPGSIPPDMVLVPKALLATQPQMMVRVKGNSMVDAGIEDGDVVKMTLDTTPRDGDIVVVAIDSECTVKSYYEDDEGQRWLVPQNKAESERYRVIRLEDELVNVHLCGVVDEVLKPLPRVSSRVLRSAVAKAKKLYEEEPKVSGQRVAAEAQEPDTNDTPKIKVNVVPEPLSTPEAEKLMGQMVKAGVLTADWQPNHLSGPERGLVAKAACDRLKVTEVWQLFGCLWREKPETLRGYFNKALNQRKSLEFQEKLKNIIY